MGTTTDTLAVEARGLVKRYGELTAVDHLDLTVEQGEVYGVLGPNGAGKTTFLRMLFGLIRPDEGSISVLGRSFADEGIGALGAVAGFIETPRFYPALTGRRNLELLAALDLRRKPQAKIEEVLEIVDLADRDGDKVGTYSYGMRQRLGVAASLLRDPQLLVIDEPTNGLDPAGIRDMRALVKQLGARGLTVLLSSHNMLEVEEICRHVTIMNTGNVVFHGTLGELRAMAPETEFLARTSQVARALEVAESRADVHGARAEEDTVRFTAADEAVEALSVAWGQAGVGIRSLAPARAALETLFFQLTGAESDSRIDSGSEAAA
jgi:ABC-2 type transport system ATP-binding protein